MSIKTYEITGTFRMQVEAGSEDDARERAVDALNDVLLDFQIAEVD